MNSRTTDENKPPIREELHMRKKSYYTNIFEDIENRVQELNSRLNNPPGNLNSQFLRR
jgi:hypothetical protein